MVILQLTLVSFVMIVAVQAKQCTADMIEEELWFDILFAAILFIQCLCSAFTMQIYTIMMPELCQVPRNLQLQAFF